MLTHIVIFTWVDSATDAQISALGEELSRMAEELKDIVSIQHGRDLKIRDGNGDYALVANFTDKAGWDAYQQHPAHKAFVRDLVTPLQASRLTIQF